MLVGYVSAGYFSRKHSQVRGTEFNYAPLGTQVKLLGLFRQGRTSLLPLTLGLSWSLTHPAHKQDAGKIRNDTTGICPHYNGCTGRGMTKA